MQKRRQLNNILGRKMEHPIKVDDGLIYTLNIIFKRRQAHETPYWVLLHTLRGTNANNEKTPWY